MFDLGTVGDINRNDQLERTEYIRFIYKLTGDFEFLGKTLEEIDPAFQTSFETLSNGNDYIDVSGTKPSDTPTEEEQENMRQVCLSTSRAIYFYVNGGSEPAPNPAVPTASPAPNPTDFVLNDADYNQCKASLALSDVNRDDWLEPDEFVRFLNQYFDNAFVSFAFEDLDESFQLSYDAARGVRVFVDIQGVRSTSPSSVEDESITAVCTEFVGAINRYADPGSDTITECLDVIAQVNKDGANVLSAQEYLVLIDALSDRLWPDSRSLDDLPFVVADNYEWLKLGNDEIDISSLGDPAATEAQKEAYDSLCERTVRVIAFAKVVADEEPDDLLAYCTIPLSNADLNGDAMLNDAEFLEFIKLLSGNAWAGQSLSTVPSPLRELFILAADQESATIPIPGSRPGDTATSSELDDLDNFCWDAEDAIVSAREVMFQFPRCKAAMVAADVDSNGRLSQAEYVVFLYDLLGEDPDGVSFEDLDRVAQVSYNLLRIRGDTDLSVAGAGSGSNVTEQEEDRLRWICANTETVLDELDTSDSDSEPTSTVYNSFIVSNKVGLKAADLQTGLEREGLDVAYSVFVEELVQSEDTSRLRGRMLQNVDLREDSARIYQLDDTACPSSASGLTCQVAYARFVLFTEDQAVRLAYEELSQEAIERGDLQAVLIRVDARNDLTIVGASRPLVPGENQGASPPPTTFTTPVIIGIAVAGGVGLIGICLALYCWYDRRRIRAAVKPSTSSVYGQEKDTSDDGSNENDYEPVFIPKTVLESIGSSSVKQESTPRSGPRKAYDQSSIDGEAYAENDDYYDEPVEEEYGYDQPDSYEEDELVEDEYGDYEEPVYGAQTQGYDDGYDDGYNYDDEPAQDPEYYDEEQYEEPYEEEYEEEEEDGYV